MSDYHEGPGFVRVERDRVVLYCPAGHFVQSCLMRDWAGSRQEAAWGVEPVRCCGTLPGATVKRVDIFGAVHDTHRTEADLNGWREKQGALFS